MVVIGGVRQHGRGVILGAILLTYLPERFRAIEEWRNVAFGVALVVIDDPAAAGPVAEPTAGRGAEGPPGRAEVAADVDRPSRRAEPEAVEPARSTDDDRVRGQPHRRRGARRRPARGRPRHPEVRRRGGPQRRRLQDPRGRDPRPDRPQRRRQDHLLQRDDRGLHAHRGRDPVPGRDRLRAARSTRSPGAASPGRSRTSGSSRR